MHINTTKKAAGASNPSGPHTHTNDSHFRTDGAVDQAYALANTEPVDLSLTVNSVETRIDSRMLAQGFGNKHKAVMSLIERYADRLKTLGILPFKKEVIKGRGQPECYCLLNEDQAYLLLSLSRNSDAVVRLKVKLVKAFGLARQSAEMRQTEYLPSLYELQKVVHAKSANSSNQRRVQVNVAKLINKAVGIQAGQRVAAPFGKQALVVVAQLVATQAMQAANDHHDGFQMAKKSLKVLSDLITPKALPLPSTGGPA